MTVTELAEYVGVSQASVSRYINGVRIPSKQMMAKIYKATHGAVTPNDFYDLPELPRGNPGECGWKRARLGLRMSSVAGRGSALDGPDSLPGQLDIFGTQQTINGAGALS